MVSRPGGGHNGGEGGIWRHLRILMVPRYYSGLRVIIINLAKPGKINDGFKTMKMNNKLQEEVYFPPCDNMCEICDSDSSHADCHQHSICNL